MNRASSVALAVSACLTVLSLGLFVHSRQDNNDKKKSSDVVEEAQRQHRDKGDRPEQEMSKHDKSDLFDPLAAPPSSTALDDQPEKGMIKGFDFRRDPLNAKKPMMTLSEIMEEDVKMKPKVMELQKKLLESRYDLKARYHDTARMSRGKKICVGP